MLNPCLFSWTVRLPKSSWLYIVYGMILLQQENSQALIVLDTNILLSHLRLVCELRDAPIPGRKIFLVSHLYLYKLENKSVNFIWSLSPLSLSLSSFFLVGVAYQVITECIFIFHKALNFPVGAGRPTLIIPWMVTQELDRLKVRSLISFCSYHLCLVAWFPHFFSQHLLVVPRLRDMLFYIHELYLTNHHSSLEHAIYRTSCLLLAFLHLTTCHLSNLWYVNLIWSLSPLSLSLSSFFLCWGFVLATMAAFP